MKKRIEQVMAEKGVTKRELASRLGILPQNVNVTISTDNLSKLKQIADAIGCDVTEFLGQTNRPIINGFLEFQGEIFAIKDLRDFFVLVRRIEQYHPNERVD